MLLISTFALCAASAPGSLVGWGDGGSAALVLPSSASGQTVAISAAAGHALALLSDGWVLAWGSNGAGESNVPEAATHYVTAVAAGYSHSMALTSAGRVIVWGSNSAGQANVPDSALSGVIQIAAGDSHCLALRSDGSVVAWGANGSGQSMVPTAALSGIQRIGAGAFHSLALTATGSVVAWGNNLFGQIGGANGELPASLSAGVTEVAGGRYHSAFLKSDGSVIALGGVGYGEANVPSAALSGVIAIACGNNHTLALKTNGSIVGWGDSGNGQSKAPASLPASGYAAVAAGEIFSLALVTNPLPVILQNPQPLTVWAGRPATLSAGAFDGTLQWQRNGVDLPGETGTTFTLAAAKLSDAGLYTMVARNASGSVTSAPPAELTVNWPTPPVVTLSPHDATLHEGMFYGGLITQVTGDDLSFQWTKDGIAVPGQTFSSYGLGVAQLAWSGVYALIATNAAGSVTSAPPARITVLPAKIPVITVNPAAVTISARSSQVVLVAQTEADAVVGYEWLKDGSVILGHSRNGFVFPNSYTTELDLGFPEESASGGYSIRIYSNAGVFTSAVVQVVVTPYVLAPPVITTGPASATVTQGDAVRFDVVATGRNLRFQWTKDGTDLPTQTGTSLILASAEKSNAGSYRVRVTNDDGTVTSNPPAVLTVNQKPTVAIATQPVGAALIAGDPLRLSVVATGKPTTYQWKKNGAAIPGATNATYRLVRSMMRNAGEYTVEVGNGFSSVTSSPPAVVTVAANPNPPTTGGVVELEPQVTLTGFSSIYYDGAADLRVPVEAQHGVVSISTFRGAVGSPIGGYSVHRLALLEDGRLVTWGYDFRYARFSINPYSSASYSRIDDSPKNAEGVIGIRSSVTDMVLRSNGSVSGFAAPDPADDGSAYAAIASSPIFSPLASDPYHQSVGSHVVALRNDGRVVDLMPQGTVPASAQSGVKAIAAGPAHSVALREDGSVVAWNVPGGVLIPVPALMSSQVSRIAANQLGFGAVTADGTVVYQKLDGTSLVVPPQPGFTIISGTPEFAITSDRRAVSWDGAHWIPAEVPVWTQGRILDRSGTCLLISEGAPVLVGTLADQSVEEVKNVTFRAPGGGAGGAYQWMHNGIAIPAATNEVLNLALVGPEDAGAYSVNISNALGSVTSAPPAQLTVTPPTTAGRYVALTVTNAESIGTDPSLTQTLPAHLRRGLLQIKGGRNHFLTLRCDGTVVAWMPKAFTQPYHFLGTYYSKYNSLVNVGQADVPEEAREEVMDIDAVETGSFALKTDGSVVGWGVGNEFHVPPSSIHKIEGGAGLYFIRHDGGVVVRSGDTVSQTGIPTAALSNVIALACQASSMAYALRSDGTVVVLSGPSVPLAAQSGIAAISAQTTQSGASFVVAAKSDGTLLGWTADGTLLSFQGGAVGITEFVDGMRYSPVSYNSYGGTWITKSGTAGAFPSSGLTIPDDWQGRIEQLGYQQYPSQYYALLLAASQKIQFDPIADCSIELGSVALTASASSGLPVQFRVVSGPAVLSGSRLQFQGVGQVTVATDQSGRFDFDPAVSAVQTFRILPANQSIRFDPIAPQTFGNAPVLLSASASSGLPVQFSVVNGPGVVAGSTLSFVGTGAVVVQAAQAGDATHASASVTQTVVVSPALQSITFAPLADVNFSGTPFPLIATSSSGLPVSFRVVSGPATLSGSQLSFTGVGVVTVSAEQSGNANVAAAASLVRTFTVNRRPQTITFERIPAQSFSQTPIPLVASSSTGSGVSFFVLSGQATVNGSSLILTGAGTVVVQAVQLGDALNEAASASQTVAITPAEQQITFVPVETLDYTSEPLTLSASASSGLPVSLRVVSGPASLAGSQLTLTGSGTVVVTAEQSGNANYKAAQSVTRSLQVSKVRQALAFALPLPSDRPYAPNLAIPLSASASSGLPVTLTLNEGPGVLTQSGLSVQGAGNFRITATQAGDAIHAAADPVTVTFVITKASQSLKVADLGSPSFGSDPIPLVGSSSSGLPVGFTVLDGPASIESGALKLTGTGAVHLAADQPGNANYEAATRALQTVEVLPGVTVTPAPPGTPGPATLGVFLPNGVTGKVEQCDALGTWTPVGSVTGGGPGTPATLLVVPPGGEASSRFWRVVIQN